LSENWRYYTMFRIVLQCPFSWISVHQFFGCYMCTDGWTKISRRSIGLRTRVERRAVDIRRSVNFTVQWMELTDCSWPSIIS
jgi:hypothetical protein